VTGRLDYSPDTTGGLTEISRRTDYAVRILAEPARRSRGDRLSARRLGDLLDVPYPFARRIVTEVSAGGVKGGSAADNHGSAPTHGVIHGKRGEPEV